MIAHHLPDDWLVSYAAGATTPAESLLVVSHLTVCPDCRRRLQDAEAVGGSLLANAPDEPVMPDLLAATLARLDEPEPVPEAPRLDPDGVLPAPLASVAGRFAELPWRWAFPGVDQLVLDVPHLADGPPARLFRIAAGGFIPAHQHRGVEASFVLTGGWTDDRGHFARGDVSIFERDSTHRQRMDDDEPCVVLVVADRPFLGRSLVGLMAQLTRGF